ncbi:hypothetical protein PRIPAC_87308, partial [Pristionchus pacificus]
SHQSLIYTDMRFIESISILLLLVGICEAFVFSCNEVKYKLINQNLEENTRYVCLVPANGYTNLEQLKKIYAQADKVSTSFFDLLDSQCIERPNEGSWRIVADNPVSLDCTREFSLIFTSSKPAIYTTYDESAVSLSGTEVIVVNAEAGIMMRMEECVGEGNVTVYTGAGSGVQEYRYEMASWRCSDVPTWIVSFDNVITVATDSGNLIVTPKSSLYHHYNITRVSPLDRITVMSSGRSDNLQNMTPANNFIDFNMGGTVPITMNCTVTFDKRYYGSVLAYTIKPENDHSFDYDINTWNTYGQAIEVKYLTDPVAPADLWDSSDNFVCDIRFGDYIEQPTTDAPTTLTPTTRAQTTPPAPTADADPYCTCTLDPKFENPLDFDPKQIWLDVVIILDITEEMGSDSIDEATILVEQFIGDGDFDVLITDPKAPFYTRVGLIAMSDRAEVIYNLNMTKADSVSDKVAMKKGVKQIDVVAAFDAAQQMLIDGEKPERSNTKQVIYYMTDGDPKFNPTTIDVFKQYGTIIVNDFIDSGVLEHPGLKNLSSPGYYRTDIQNSYTRTIQLFCKANCFCRQDIDRKPYAGHNEDIAVQAAGGCFHAAPAGVSYSKMVSTCNNLEGGGKIVSIHDMDKAQFVNTVYNNASIAKDYYWIGYAKDDAGKWNWEDASTNPWTNWDTANGEPSLNSVSKCAYVDRTTGNLLWGAGNCQTGFPSVCEFKPCMVGNANC